MKENAKSFLSRHYLKALVVCIIVGLFFNTNPFYREIDRGTDTTKIPVVDEYVDNYEEIVPDDNIRRGIESLFIKLPFGILRTGTYLFISIIIFIFILSVGELLFVGSKKFFIEGYNEEAKISMVFSMFNKNDWLNIIKTQFTTKIYIMLWSILFIIPGIIKSYEYRFVPYIKSENPNISTKEAIRLSRNMTDGNKFDMFILFGFSFILWDILGILFLGIGHILVLPYKTATEASLYLRLKENLNSNDRLIINENY